MCFVVLIWEGSSDAMSWQKEGSPFSCFTFTVGAKLGKKSFSLLFLLQHNYTLPGTLSRILLCFEFYFSASKKLFEFRFHQKRC